MDIRMTSLERQEFLAEVRVGIICVAEEGRGPLAVPVWYSYQPGGDVCIWTGAKSRKGKLMLKAERISFCVQDPNPAAYKYVTVEGPFTISPVDPEEDILPLAIRYFGVEKGEAYFAEVSQGNDWKEDILVRIRPERWYSADFSKAPQV
jgi:nitroimidazol reductase NimA-like FMN-containing flavoprotein (pyridoxamine 5'-phosphate oxidase superfamily)